jgi:hypothetical protein
MIRVTISVGKCSYSEIIEEDALREYFEGCQNVEWDQYIRPLDISAEKEFDSLNGNHFLFGFIECFSQSDSGASIIFGLDEKTRVRATVTGLNPKQPEWRYKVERV